MPRFIARLALIAFLFAPFARADAPASHPAFTTVDQTWHDAARDRDVPVLIYLPAEAGRPAPTIVVSHGLGDSRHAMGYACREWAGRGYVVVALQHAGSDGRVGQGLPPRERFGALLRAASVAQFVARCADVPFALDELARRNAEPGPLAGRVDLDRIGGAGHSFGSLTMQAMIGQRYAPQPGVPGAFAEPRIKAAVLMSPGVEGVVDPKAAFAQVRTPAMHVTGTFDAITGIGATPASKRRLPFDRMNGSDQYLVVFKGGDHVVFSGQKIWKVDDALYERIKGHTARLTGDFFDVYVKAGDVEAARDRLARDAEALGDEATFEAKPAVDARATTAPARQ